MSFAGATALTESEPGTWAGAIAPDWDIVGNANGGYLLALAGRTMAGTADRQDVTSITGHFLRPGKEGPVTVSAEVVKAGRRFTTVHATVAAAKPLISALGTFTDLRDSLKDQRTMIIGERPLFPGPDECQRVEASETFPPKFMSNVDLRLHPDDNFYHAPSGNLLMRGWLKHINDEPWDSIGLLLASDAFPPTIFNSSIGVAWVPTLELTVHVRKRPAPGWLQCHFSSRFVSEGFVEEDGLMWDATGTLVAQSRQLSLLPRTADNSA